jgi:tetratricopeptide (TPR) repeat protein
MNNIGHHTGSEGNIGFMETGFKVRLERAAELLRNNEIEQALALLNHLKDEYIASASIFDYLGDVFLQRGDVKEGIKYKTLHEVVCGTFKILQQTASEPKLQEPEITKDLENIEETAPPPLPVTYSMGQECMRQGHYDKALEIFNQLSEKNENDPTLRLAIDRARKKKNEKQMASVLQGWLTNLHKIKAQD